MHLNIIGLVKFDLHFVLSRVFDAPRQCGVCCSVRVVALIGTSAVVCAHWYISCCVR